VEREKLAAAVESMEEKNRERAGCKGREGERNSDGRKL
jgi:hypothetical protein